MRPLSQFSAETAAMITSVFTDIDDTMTTCGRLPSSAYQALEQLFAAGFDVVPVTGRPAGWCDMIARLWPVSAVIGENGAFYFAYDHARKKMRREFFASPDERRANQKKLDKIKNRILSEVPGCAVSADQNYRQTDLAIDFCEDVAPLNDKSVTRIKQIFADEGATAKISSIHVNGWFGHYDKLSMSRRLANEVLGFDLDSNKDRIVFCGDSPNDAAMFAFFPNSCGVANVLDFTGRLAAEPKWITQNKSGAGFVEIAQKLLRSKKDTQDL